MAFVIVGGVATGGAGISCSNGADGESFELGDAAPEATASAETGPVDAGVPDVEPRDAAPFDGGPRPIVCASKPCATSLVTTRPPVEKSIFDEEPAEEGYCALLDDGSVACWGANGYGQLGRGDDAGTRSPTAMRVEALSDVTQLDHTCALDKDGAIWCWGTGAFLKNDAGASSTERKPVKLALPPAKRVATGFDVSCAVVDDGVLCWGKNTNGLIAPFDVALPTAALPATSVRLPVGAPIRDLFVGKAAFAVREDGVTLSWGANPPLGRVSSMVPDPNPMAIPLVGIATVDEASDQACAAVSGIGYCWGGRALLERIVPEPIATPEPVVQFAAARGASPLYYYGTTPIWAQRWCAVGASGALYCWGSNEGGQAGDGTRGYASEPVKVAGLPDPVAEVRTLQNSTCALLTTGKVYCWGTNYYGQLGNGKSRIPSLVPQEVELP